MRRVIVFLIAVVLSWDANTEPDLIGYRIYRNGVKIAEVQATVTTFTDDQNTSGIYHVTAFSPQGESSASNTVVVGPIEIRSSMTIY